jgi:hypothetical protein
MKKIKIMLLAFLLVTLNLSAQTPLIPATQINQVNSTSLGGLDADINDQHYAILYVLNNTTYMNVYDASNYSLIGSPVQIASSLPGLARVEIDDNNRIYVMYESSNNIYSLNSYDINGNSVSFVNSEQVASHTGVYSTGGEVPQDMSITVSGTSTTVLVAIQRKEPNQNKHELVLKHYDNSLTFLNEQMIVQSLPITDESGINVDGNKDHYATVHYHKPGGQNTMAHTEYNRYNLSSSNPLSTYVSSSTSYHALIHQGILSAERLALKEDGKILSIEKVISSNTSRLVEIDLSVPTPVRNVLLNDITAVDVAVNDNYVITDGFEKYEMYNGNTNGFVHSYTVDEEISQPKGTFGTGNWNNLSWLYQFTIHNCQLLVGGKHGNDWSTFPNGNYDSQLYYQLFSPEVECDDIVIELEDMYYMCDQFTALCGPVSYGCDVYSYYWTDPNGNTIATPTECYTPTMYGDYILTVSVNGSDCIKKHYFTISNEGEPISIDDVFYCKDIDGYPTLIGFDNLTGSQGIVEIIWTYEGGTPFSSGTNQQINYIGDGEYCVQVIWENECVSETCFIVKECCEPDMFFYSGVEFTVKGGTKLTVGPGQGANPNIIAEEFVLYEYCDLKHTTPACNSPLWYQVDIIQGNSTINGNVQFNYSLNPSCMYKVVYRVTSECDGVTYENCQIVFYPESFFAVLSPNPTATGKDATLSLTSDSPQAATVEIRNVYTGAIVHVGELTSDEPMTLNSDVLRIESGVYTIQIYNNERSEVLRWVIE